MKDGEWRVYEAEEEANNDNSAPTDYNSAATYTLTDVVATVNDDGISSTCTIGEVDMVGPSWIIDRVRCKNVWGSAV